MKLSCGGKIYTAFFFSLKGIQELFKINFSPMIREKSLKKNSLKVHRRFSWPSAGYKTVFKKSLNVIWTYFWVGSAPIIQKTVFSEVVIKIFDLFLLPLKILILLFHNFSFLSSSISPLSFFNFHLTKNILALPDLLDPSYCMVVKHNDKISVLVTH